ncbi:NAD(P)/FAD-dependent oxidoreductase [Psychrobacter sp. HD31]|uniref:NAD(P)/FAD-dependent oxidoreductase n=1 Tax=Psychrobacter sp. HD31 TaxID=3112003 RepID=UPI003DA2744B
MQTIKTEVLIIGAGASGLFCAMTAGGRGRKVTVIDHANKAGKKILMSGGGRCNFTNYFVEPENYISHNAHFCKSALSRYSNWEFIGMVAKHQIPYHERDYGQLFCDVSSKDIVKMLLTECEQVGVDINLHTEVVDINVIDQDTTSQSPASIALLEETDFSTKYKFAVTTQNKDKQRLIYCESLVIATGGLSITTMGATGLGYQIAQQFGHQLMPTTAGLVPFTFTDKLGEVFASLSGISLDVVAFNERASFARPLLFTHRGLSGFAMLQLSNYWQQGETIHLNLMPNVQASELLLTHKAKHPKQRIRTALAEYFPKNLLSALQSLLWAEVTETELANIKDETLVKLGNTLNDWEIKPSGTEGYRTAEVTRGGVATDEVSSKTMESKRQQGLYFVGEVLDVTGWLGGYNFQWAWASGFVCGEVV